MAWRHVSIRQHPFPCSAVTCALRTLKSSRRIPRPGRIPRQALGTPLGAALATSRFPGLTSFDGAAAPNVIPMTPGYLCAVELSRQQLFQIADLPAEVIGPIELLNRVVNYWFILFAGGMLLIFERRRSARISEVIS